MYNTIMKRSLLVLILLLLAGSIPVLIYFSKYPQTLDVNIASLPSRNLSPLEQGAQALAGLVVKPIYMMLSLVIILALIGQPAADISALRWGQITFLAGEVFCAINFYIFRHESVLSEYLHSYGMALAFGFTSFALFEGLDRRILKLTSSRSACEALRVCGRCTRHEREGCKARAVFQFVIPVLILLSFIPILSPLQSDAYAVSIFGFPYSYTRFDFYEVYERRILPILASIAFILAYLPLWRKGEPPIPSITKALLSAGIGALGFSFFRVTLNAVFVDSLVWFEFWEEATELMFVGLVAFALWEFRGTLLQKTPMLEGIGISFK